MSSRRLRNPPEDGSDGVRDDVTTRRVFTTPLGTGYHCDFDCPQLRTEYAALGSDPGFTEAVLAYNYGRAGCATCAADFDRALRRELVAHPPRFAAHPMLLPLSAFGYDGAETETIVEVASGVLDVPYGEPQDSDDVRFSVQSSVGWGTNAYGQNPDEFLGEPTEDENDWIRGSSRFLD